MSSRGLLMNYNFMLLNKTQKTIQYINKILINFPNKEQILKGNIEKNMYEMIECIFAYQINDTDRIKQKYLKDFLVKLSMLNFYIATSLEKKIISKHQCEVIGNFLIEIRKITYGVIKSENNTKV